MTVTMTMIVATAVLGRKTRRSGLGERGRATTRHHIASRACSSECTTTTTIHAVIAIRVLILETETETEIEIEIGIGIETVNANTTLIVVGGEVEVEIEIEIGMEVEVEVGTGLRYAFAGLLAEPTLPSRLTRRCTSTSTSAAGRKSQKMAIGGGRRTEAGVGNASLGRAGMTGAREVRNTKEGMRDEANILLSRHSRLNTITTRTQQHHLSITLHFWHCDKGK